MDVLSKAGYPGNASTIGNVIKFGGSHDALVWKHPSENFDVTSQLIVDETHEALFVVNGNTAGIYRSGCRPLPVPDIPVEQSSSKIPTGGDSPYSCRIYFINTAQAVELLWKTERPILLEDPLYEIFIQVTAIGSMSVTVEDSHKFMLKVVGFRDSISPEDLVSKFRGIVTTHVKDCISKIMVNGMLSYFMLNAHLMELNCVIKERLDIIFREHGVKINHFSIDTIEVPETDYKKINEAKERRARRLIEGYTWQEERRMLIAEKYACNQGAIILGAIDGSIAEIAKYVLNPGKLPESSPPRDLADVHTSPKPLTQIPHSPMNPGNHKATNGADWPEHDISRLERSERVPKNANGLICPNCSTHVPNSRFCSKCGHRLRNDSSTSPVSDPKSRDVIDSYIFSPPAPTLADNEKRLLDEIKRSCQCIQDDPVYHLIKDENRHGCLNGDAMEDQRNRRIRDDLIRMGFTVADQSQRGSGGTGARAGELDMLLLNDRGEPWTILEALRVSNGTKASWNKHLDKLLGKYNSRGLPLLYLLTYVDVDPKAYARIWKGYQAHIQKYSSSQFAVSEGSYTDLNDANSPQYIKVAKCQYTCGSDPITVYHIFARIPTKNK